MIHLRLQIELTLVGPILTQSTAAGRLGLDAVMARTSDGKPYLPYSLVRGKLRQGLEELADANGQPERRAIADNLPFWFGPRRDDDTTIERGALLLGDFVHPNSRNDEKTRTRIRIDRDTGAAEDGMLQVLDSPFGVGEEATFVGEVRCVCATPEQASATERFVPAGLRWVRNLGAERTIGFGRLSGVRVVASDRKELAPARPAPPAGTERFVLRIRPRGPFCVAGVRRAGNVYDSEQIIPGGAIVGALATTWRQAMGRPANDTEVRPGLGGKWEAFAAALPKLTVGHAFPAKLGSKRPTAVPLSLVAAEPWVDDIPPTLYDVALCEAPQLVPHAGGLRPPVFRPDWKSHVVGKKADELFEWAAVPRELRVRTAIDSDTLRAADEQLFGYRTVVPDGHEWLAHLDLGKVENRDAVLADLRHLLAAGLGPLGKTKVTADVTLEPAAAPAPPAPLPGGVWVVTLQTPAVLCSTADLQPPVDTTLHNGYARTWGELSGGSLELVRFFAMQTLSAPRFAGRLPTDARGRYTPFVLTDPGSVFVLKADAGKANEAAACIDNWVRHGVPVHDDLLGGRVADGDDWKRCPFLNRHGYGEIAVNPEWLVGRTEGLVPVEGVK